MKNLEGCQYSVCCHNDEYQELKRQLSKLQQEKKDLIKWLEENVKRENHILKLSLTQESKINSLTIIACFEQVLSKLKESDSNEIKNFN